MPLPLGAWKLSVFANESKHSKALSDSDFGSLLCHVSLGYLGEISWRSDFWAPKWVVLPTWHKSVSLVSSCFVSWVADQHIGSFWCSRLHHPVLRQAAPTEQHTWCHVQPSFSRGFHSNILKRVTGITWNNSGITWDYQTGLAVGMAICDTPCLLSIGSFVSPAKLPNTRANQESQEDDVDESSGASPHPAEDQPKYSQNRPPKALLKRPWFWLVILKKPSIALVIVFPASLLFQSKDADEKAYQCHKNKGVNGLLELTQQLAKGFLQTGGEYQLFTWPWVNSFKSWD